MFTVRKLALRFLSQISFYFWSIGPHNSTINLFVSTVNILFSRMNLSNWTITLYFSTSEFKLDTLLSGLACHSYARFRLARSAAITMLESDAIVYICIYHDSSNWTNKIFIADIAANYCCRAV